MFFDTLPVVILRLVLKIGEHSFQVREEEKVAWGKVWRIRWMGEQIEAQFMQFRHRFHGLVARRIVLVKQKIKITKVASLSIRLLTN